MDFLTPPTAAFENLTITESLSPPTTSLENLTISGRDAEKNKPRKQKHIKPSREELFRLAHLTTLITRWYGLLKTCQSCIPHETNTSPGPSNNIVSADERINKFRLQCSKRLSNRVNFISFRLIFIGRRITHKLSIMAEDKPEHREKLLLAKSYVQQRKNKEEVLSIIKSLYTNY